MTENSLILSYQQQYWDRDYAYNAGPAEEISLSLAAVTDRGLRDTLEQIIDHPDPGETIITHSAGAAGIDIEPVLVEAAQKMLGRTLTGPWYMNLTVGVEDTYGALSDWLRDHPFIERVPPFPEQDPSKPVYDPISEIGYAVRTSFALGHARKSGIEFEQGPELDRLIQQTADRLNLTEEKPADDKIGLPEKPDTIIIANNEHKRIQAMAEGLVWSTREAVLGWDGTWLAVWRSDDRVRGFMTPECIIEGTCKVEAP